MTDISTGNLASSGTTTYIVGTASGIDTSALVDIAVAQKTQKADRIDIQVDENDATIAAYDELRTLTLNLQTSLESLTAPDSLISGEENVFASRAGYVSTSDGSDASAYADITIDSDAELATYEIEITQKAKAAQVAGDTYADPDADLGHTGSFTIGLSGGGSQQVDVTSDMSLQELSAAINAVSNTTGVVASVLKVSENGYRLILTAQDTNQAIDIVSVSGDDVMNLIGVTDGLGGFQDELQAPQPAILELDGVTITRDDNNFDDLIDGVSIDVLNAAPGTTITLDIASDSQSIKDAITSFIDSYNALREFILSNQEVSSDGEVSDSAPLFSDIILESLSSEITTLLGADFSGSSSLATIRDLGITFDSNNYLVISDETALDTAILDNPDAVESFFASSATTDNDELALIRNESSQASQDFVLDITVSGGTITSVSVGGDTSAFTINGTRIIGAEGTIYEGLNFSYQGTTSASINVSVNQGLADLLDQSVDSYANSVDGLIIQEKASLQSQNELLSEEATEIRARAEDFRQTQLAKYAEMEAKIEALKLLQDQIRAILGIDNDE